MTGPALDSIKTLGEKKESFDIIFMDADKPNYENYYKVMTNNIAYSSKIVFCFICNL